MMYSDRELDALPADEQARTFAKASGDVAMYMSLLDYYRGKKNTTRQAEIESRLFEAKVNDDAQTASKYKEMANDELRHAAYQHEWAAHKIAELSKLYTPPVEMQEKWEKAHKEFVEKVAWIKQMLAM